ncbi:MAG: hypothetical protein AAF743_00085 [Planctomycetota bacterium]
MHENPSRTDHQTHHQLRPTTLAAAALAVLWCAASAGALVVRAPIADLLPDTPGQQLEISVSGGEQVQGVDLYVQIGDGGPELSDFGVAAGTPAPVITDIDLLDGTIYAAAADTPADPGSIPQVAFRSLAITDPGFVAVADGKLATITVDTTGFFDGTFDLLLGDVLPFLVLGGPYQTTFEFGGTEVPPTIENGTITIIPEPTLAAFALALLATRRRQPRRRRR